MQQRVSPHRRISDENAPNSGYSIVGKDASGDMIGVYFEFAKLQVDGEITGVEVHAPWNNAAAGAGNAGRMVLEIIPGSGSYLMYASGDTGEAVQALSASEYSTTRTFDVELYPHDSSPDGVYKGFANDMWLIVTYQKAPSGPACKVKVNGVWRGVAQAKVKKNGAWQPVNGQVYTGGAWRPW